MSKTIKDYTLLEKVLSTAGFSDITKVNFMEGSDKRLLHDMPDRKWETLYIEAKKV